jgi:two-component system sensor histidine kinase BaeS
MRDSLLVRIVIATVVVVTVAILGTVWLVNTTAVRYDLTKADKQWTADTEIREALDSYATSHSSWTQVDELVRALSAQYGRRIALVGDQGTIVDSNPNLPLPADGAPIDPLGMEQSGPLQLDRASASLGPYRGDSGSDAAATAQLRVLLDACRAAWRLPPVSTLSVADEGVLDFSVEPGSALNDASGCFGTALRVQLRPWMAPPATLVTSDFRGDERGPLDLTNGSLARIGLIALVIILLILGAAAAVGAPALRRVHELTRASRRLADGESGARVRVRGHDQIAQLGAAFNDMADARERMESQRTHLFGDIAHELRTPLTNLRGWLEAMEDGVVDYDPHVRTLLLDEANQLQRIVSELQDLTLAESGELTIKQDLLDLTGLLNSATLAHAAEAQARGIALETRIEPGLETVGDAGRLRQVCDNLLSNALAHTSSGGRVTVSASQHAAEVVAAFADTGAGIQPSDLDRVFDRFWRADESRSRLSGGSGLGLAIVRKFVEAHGGSVSVTSEVGVGSTFELRFPQSAPSLRSG